MKNYIITLLMISTIDLFNSLRCKILENNVEQ